MQCAKQAARCMLGGAIVWFTGVVGLALILALY